MNSRLRIRLVPPAERWRESFLRGFREFRREGLPWWVGDDLETAEGDFATFVARTLAESSPATDTLVPRTHLWGVADDSFVGRISIHHGLNEELRVEGGHIGYDTVPSFRSRGVATEMLRQALPLARSLGLDEVLLTCDDSNVASIRVIERNGDVLRETKVLAAHRPLKRYYWIGLASSPPSAIRRRNLELMEKAQADLHGDRAHNDCDAGMDQTMRECDESPPPRLLEGIAQFNRGEYFEQHETLELLWRAEPRKVRHLYQGILQIGVAFHHLRRGNYHGTIYMLTRGTRYLTPFSPRCQGVDVERLLTDATTVLRTVERLGPDRLGEFDWQLVPMVRLCPGHPL